jgi:hypothetical protein
MPALCTEEDIYAAMNSLRVLVNCPLAVRIDLQFFVTLRAVCVILDDTSPLGVV